MLTRILTSGRTRHIREGGDSVFLLRLFGTIRLVNMVAFWEYTFDTMFGFLYGFVIRKDFPRFWLRAKASVIDWSAGGFLSSFSLLSCAAAFLKLFLLLVLLLLMIPTKRSRGGIPRISRLVGWLE